MTIAGTDNTSIIPPHPIRKNKIVLTKFFKSLKITATSTTKEIENITTAQTARTLIVPFNCFTSIDCFSNSYLVIYH